MLITSGRHKGMTIEIMVIKDPVSIGNLLATEPRSERQRRHQTEARRLVETFNRRAFDVRCVGTPLPMLRTC